MWFNQTEKLFKENGNNTYKWMRKKATNIYKCTSLNKTKNSKVESNSNTSVKEKYIVLPQNPSISFIEKNLNRLALKMITRTSKTIKLLLRNNNNNKTKSYSDADCQDCPRSNIKETSRNLPKRIKEHTRDFKSGNFSNAFVIYNISKK